MCALANAATWLLVIGGLNWGLIAIGAFVGMNWNVVNLLLSFSPMLELIVYLLVGISAVVVAFGCPCLTCKKGRACCGKCNTSATKMESEKTPGDMMNNDA